MGVRVRSDRAGTVTGLRFYKAPANTGTQIGNLWTASGQLLASVTFMGESASGWQTAAFTPSVAIAANTTYVISYHAPNGHYSADNNYLYNSPAPPTAPGSGVVDSPPLRAQRSTTTSANGVYVYSPESAFPTNPFRGTNYWVDPIFGP